MLDSIHKIVNTSLQKNRELKQENIQGKKKTNHCLPKHTHDTNQKLRKQRKDNNSRAGVSA